MVRAVSICGRVKGAEAATSVAAQGGGQASGGKVQQNAGSTNVFKRPESVAMTQGSTHVDGGCDGVIS